MAGSTEILQEYLVKLGYTVDQVSLGKFNAGISDAGKTVLKVGGAVATAVGAVEGAVAQYAYSIRKMYFQSQLANTSIKNLQGWAYAGKQIGIGENAIADGAAHMERNFRSLGGEAYRGWIKSVTGIETHGKRSDAVIKGVIKSLSGMQEGLGQMYAQQWFGWDSDTYHLMITNQEKLNAAQEESAGIYSSMGLDQDKAAEALRKHADGIDKLGLQFKALGAVLLIEFAPVFTNINDRISKSIQLIADLARGATVLSGGSLFDFLKGQLGFDTKADTAAKDAMGVKPINELSKGQNAVEGSGGAAFGIVPGALRRKQAQAAKQTPAGTQPLPAPPASAVPPNQAVVLGDAQAHLAQLEKDKGLPTGLMDRVWKKESNRGDPKFMNSSAGAQGPFQLMPGTSAQYGVKNPYDFTEASSAAAKMFADLLKKYDNDIQKALIGYNWGQGNLDSYLKTGKGLSRGGKPGTDLPAESRNYAEDISGTKLGNHISSPITVQNNVTITVAGNDTPRETARAIANELSRTNQDTLRNGIARIR